MNGKTLTKKKRSPKEIEEYLEKNHIVVHNRHSAKEIAEFLEKLPPILAPRLQKVRSRKSPEKPRAQEKSK